ncbi:MAG: hypothetical protein ACRC80_37140 [Waterburya sp.]
MTSNSRKIEHLKREELKQQIKDNQGWYFITSVRELPRDRPYGFTLYNEPFVLFRDKDENLLCYLLSSLFDIERHDKLEILLFPVVEEQGMIWFWRGKI